MKGISSGKEEDVLQRFYHSKIVADLSLQIKDMLIEQPKSLSDKDKEIFDLLESEGMENDAFVIMAYIHDIYKMSKFDVKHGKLAAKQFMIWAENLIDGDYTEPQKKILKYMEYAIENHSVDKKSNNTLYNVIRDADVISKYDTNYLVWKNDKITPNILYEKISEKYKPHTKKIIYVTMVNNVSKISMNLQKKVAKRVHKEMKKNKKKKKKGDNKNDKKNSKK